MPNLVIVALPTEDDYVNKISSEPAAHMTLLFLGDISQVPNLTPILDFVEHAANTSLLRFGMEVDHRGVLGVDQADVLFFSKNKWSGFETINDFRSNLLKNTDIRKAYDSTAQHPEWIPHMTLGYPEAPAKPDTRDYPGITYVSFDRIAVWNQEFDGVEFPLKAYSMDVTMAMGQGQSAVVDILEHHGIKGMHWGQRKVDPTTGRTRKESRQIQKTDKKWIKGLSSTAKYVEVHNRGAEKFNARIGAYNKKFEGKDLVHDPVAMAKYDKGIARMMNESHSEAYNEIHGTSPSGKQRIHKWIDADGNPMITQGPSDFVAKSLAEDHVVGIHQVRHSAADGVMTYRLIEDENGFVVRIEPQVMAQSATFTGDILEHHGVKGMKWGHRKGVHPDIADVPRGTRKAAQRDAREHTRAAMFFGEGAGTRRKLIKARVEARKQRDPLYAKAFDHFVKQTNMDKRASQARRERRRQDNSKMAGRLLKDVLLTQGATFAGDVLEHHGVKGMKWGVRRENLSGAASGARTAARRKAGLAGPQEVKIKDRRKKIKTSGGQGHPAHEDAVTARTIGQRGKASGLKSLSNKELEQYSKRLQLEANVNRLNYGEKSAGKKFVADLLNKNGKAALTSASEQAGSHAAKKAIRSKAGRRVAKGAVKIGLAVAA